VKTSFRIIGLMILAGVAAIVPLRADAGIVLATPTGLSAGAHFRFIFVTPTTTNASSTDISTYDTFVRDMVSTQYGAVTYGGSAITNWLSLGSTSTVNAKDHLGGYSSTVSVWRPDGTQVATSMSTSTGGLWSGTLLSNPDQTLNGTAPPGIQFKWTGSNTSGVASSGLANPLGSGGSVGFGYIGTAANWIAYSSGSPDFPLHLYGVSPELVVPGAVPEIDPAGIGSVLALVTGALGLLERRRLKTA